MEPATEIGVPDGIPYDPNAYNFLEDMAPWIALIIPATIAYFGGKLISHVSGTAIRFLSLALFMIAPIILWFTAAYADGCWLNAGVGRPECMWVPFGALVFTVPFIIYCAVAIIGYVLGRRKQKATNT